MKLITLILAITISTLAAELPELTHGETQSTYFEDRRKNPYNAIKNGRAAEEGMCFAVKKGKMVYMKLADAVKFKALPFRYSKNARAYIVKTTGKAPSASGLNSTRGL